MSSETARKPDPGPIEHEKRVGYVRLPGLFRLEEMHAALRDGSTCWFVQAATAADGAPLFAAYWWDDEREPAGSAWRGSRARARSSSCAHPLGASAR